MSFAAVVCLLLFCVFVWGCISWSKWSRDSLPSSHVSFGFSAWIMPVIMRRLQGKVTFGLKHKWRPWKQESSVVVMNSEHRPSYQGAHKSVGFPVLAGCSPALLAWRNNGVFLKGPCESVTERIKKEGTAASQFTSAHETCCDKAINIIKSCLWLFL